MKAVDLLADFIKRMSDRTFMTNEWLHGSDMEVYVRKSVPRLLNDGKRYVTLDIANVEVHERGQGHFTRFLEQAHKLNPWPATYIENVLEPRFGQFFVKQGYTRHMATEPASYYLVKK